jgi:predicted Fe-Mo cluster-binding NifX family protein
MKIAVTSKGPDTQSEVDPRFGRAAYIVYVDSDTFDFEYEDNSKNANALKGAGIQAASAVVEKGASVLITGYCGPNAFKALKAGNVGVADNAEGTVKEAVEAFLAGKLPLADAPNVDGQW